MALPDKAEPAEPAAPTSEFFVVAEGLDGYGARPSALRLAEIEGATFLAEPPLAYRDGTFVPVGMGDAFALSGRWPEDVWAFSTPECQANGAVDAPGCPSGVDVVLWKKDRWIKQGFLELDVTSKPPTLNPWTRQRALTFSERGTLSNEGVETHAVHNVDVFGEGTLPPLRARAVHGYQVTSARVIGSDEVLVFGTAVDDKPFVELWRSDGRAESVSLPLGAKVWARDWNHMLVVDGYLSASLFDGPVAKPFSLPPSSTVVLSYAREPSGREWLVNADRVTNWQDQPTETRLFVRRPGQSWTRVELPPSEFPGVTEDDRIKVTDVRVSGEGDVWLRGWTAGDCHGRGVILHNVRPAKNCFLERTARACSERPKARGPKRPDCTLLGK